MKLYYTYILYSTKLKTFYKGSTANLKSRLMQHNLKYEKYTAQGAPWLLIWATQKQTKSEAYILEHKLKNL